MIAKEAKYLRPGTPVYVYNGKYETKVTVTAKEKHANGYDWWIDYEWTRKGKRYSGRKKNCSVHLQQRKNEYA